MEQVTPELEGQGVVQAIDIDQQEGFSRLLNTRALLAVGSSVVAMMGVGELGLKTDSSPASVTYQCKNILAPGYNTIVCGHPKKQVEERCTSAAIGTGTGEGMGVGQFKSGYVKGSHSKYSISYWEADIHGCDPVGLRKTSVYQQLRKGSAGNFETNSNTLSVITNQNRNEKETLVAPYNCTADMAGSAVRSVVKITWLPRKGWGKSKSNIAYAKPQPIC